MSVRQVVMLRYRGPLRRLTKLVDVYAGARADADANVGADGDADVSADAIQMRKDNSVTRLH